VPAVFTYVDDFEGWMKRQGRRLRRTPAETPAPATTALKHGEHTPS
jgi:hypothetical protein